MAWELMKELAKAGAKAIVLDNLSAQLLALTLAKVMAALTVPKWALMLDQVMV